MIDFDTVKAIGPYLLSTLAALFAGARWASARAFVTREDFSVLSKKVEAQVHDIAMIRKDIEHLPDADQFAQLSQAVVKLTAMTDALDERVTRIDAAVTRIEDYLLKGRS